MLRAGIVGLPNGSFIRIKDSNIEIVGNYYVIKDGKLGNKNNRI